MTETAMHSTPIAMAAGCRFAPARVGRKAVGKVVRVTQGPGIP